MSVDDDETKKRVVREIKSGEKKNYSQNRKKEDCATTTFASRCFLIIGTYSIDHVQSTVLQPQFVAAFPSQSYALVFYSLLFLFLFLLLFSSVRRIQVVERDARHALGRAERNDAARKGVTPARVDVPDVHETAFVEVGGYLVALLVERDGTERGADDVRGTRARFLLRVSSQVVC